MHLFFSNCVRPFLKLNRPDTYPSVIFVPQNHHMLSAFCFVLRHSSMPVSVQRCQAVVYQSYGRIPMMAITSAPNTCVSWWQGALKTLYALLVIEFEFRHKMIRRVMSIIILVVVDYCCVYTFALSRSTIFQIASFMGHAWGPPGSFRPQMGPMLAPWTLLSGMSNLFWFVIRMPFGLHKLTVYVICMQLSPKCVIMGKCRVTPHASLSYMCYIFSTVAYLILWHGYVIALGWYIFGIISSTYTLARCWLSISLSVNEGC